MRSPTDADHEARIHGRVYSVIRESAERFAERSGWKKHVPWLVAALGEALGVVHSFVYKNYPDTSNEITAVRLCRWTNPLSLSTVHISDPRVSRYEGSYLAYLREELSERRPVLCTRRSPLPPLREYMESNSIETVVVVPVFAGDQWWGFLGVEDRTPSTGELPAETVGDILGTVATVLGESIRGSGLDQALRWSERLQRVQRDIALTIARVQDRSGSVSELLELICSLGDFDAGTIEIVQEGLVRIASHGQVPEAGSHGWCDSCRPSFHEAQTQPVYGDATMLEFCDSSCPVRASGFHSYAVIPVVYKGAATARILLFSSRRSVVPAAVRRSLEAIGTEIGMIISTLRSHEGARVDISSD